MSESYFSQSVGPHEAAFVHIAVHAVDASLTRILPHLKLSAIVEHWFLASILGNHQLVTLQSPREVAVIEIRESVEERLLLVGFLQHIHKLEQRVTESLVRQAAGGFNVEHRNQVLVARTALGCEIPELLLEVGLGPEEMIGAHFQSVFMSQVYVGFIFLVDAVAAFGAFDVDIRHLGGAHRFPEYVALIVAQVNAVDMGAGVFTLSDILSMQRQGANRGEHECKKSFHSCKVTKKYRPACGHRMFFCFINALDFTVLLYVMEGAPEVFSPGLGLHGVTGRGATGQCVMKTSILLTVLLGLFIYQSVLPKDTFLSAKRCLSPIERHRFGGWFVPFHFVIRGAR